MVTVSQCHRLTDGRTTLQVTVLQATWCSPAVTCGFQADHAQCIFYDCSRLYGKHKQLLRIMEVFLTNLPCVLLTVIYIMVFSFISASDVVDDTWSRRLRDELVTVGHMIDVPSGYEQSSVRHRYSNSSCQDAVAQLTDAVTQYANCVSVNALNSSVCESCVDYYLNANALAATNFSV